MPPPPLPSVSVPRSPTSIGIGATLWLHRFIYRASSKSAERRRQEEEKYNEQNYVGKTVCFARLCTYCRRKEASRVATSSQPEGGNKKSTLGNNIFFLKKRCFLIPIISHAKHS